MRISGRLVQTLTPGHEDALWAALAKDLKRGCSIGLPMDAIATRAESFLDTLSALAVPVARLEPTDAGYALQEVVQAHLPPDKRREELTKWLR